MPLLQQQEAVAIGDLYRDRAMQLAVAMRGELRCGADLAVLGVDQDDVLVRVDHAVLRPLVRATVRQESQSARLVVAAQIM